MKFEITVDQQVRQVDVDESKPLLWVLKEDLEINNAKFSCGFGACGACSVYVGDTIVRSCVYPISAVQGKEVRTVAGLNDSLAQSLKDAWRKFDVPQCGYCQPGFILSAHQILSKQDPNEELSLDSLTNLCRCGTYERIRQAVGEAFENHKSEQGE
ncbi:MAG: (2Fe-2S)-binding protein [Oligoflexus sp.]